MDTPTTLGGCPRPGDPRGDDKKTKLEMAALQMAPDASGCNELANVLEKPMGMPTTFAIIVSLAGLSASERRPPRFVFQRAMGVRGFARRLISLVPIRWIESDDFGPQSVLLNSHYEPLRGLEAGGEQTPLT